MADNRAIKLLTRKAKAMSERRTNKDIRRAAQEVQDKAGYQAVRIQAGNSSVNAAWYITFDLKKGEVLIFSRTFPIRGTKNQVYDYLTAMKMGLELKEMRGAL